MSDRKVASEWDGFLEDLAHKAAWEAVDKPDTEKVFLRVLRAKLLPLLEAGQAMRDTWAMSFPANGAVRSWDAARAAALKGSNAH